MKKTVQKMEFESLSAREMRLSVIVGFLLGVIIGMLISPKGNRSYGCNNGSTKIFNNKTDLEEKDNNDCK